MPPEEAPQQEVVSDLPTEDMAEAQAPEVAFTWQASEYVHHHKSLMWYGTVVMAVIVLAAIAAWLQLWLSIGGFIAAGAAVLVYASKPPRTLTYELSTEGVHISGKLYGFEQFRSFSVVEEPEWHSIDLEPSKRFSPRLVMLYDPQDFNEIVGHLELHLPREDREPDFIERFTRFVRF